MKRFTKGLLAAAATVALVGALTLGATTADAQGRGGQGGAMNWAGSAMLIGACSTTDYTDVAAGALNMTASELRVALAGGANLTRIAAQKGVELTAVQEALRTARIAEVDQALADGLITAEQATLLKNLLSGQTPLMQGTPMAPGLRGRTDRPGVGIMMQRVNLLAGINARNTVKPYIVSAEALGISCADLLKAAQGGQSIAQVAAEKGIALQTVVDALTKAYSDALAKDVEEGLVAKARADAMQAQIVNNVLGIISRPHGRFGIGIPMPRMGRSGVQFFEGELPEDAFTLLDAGDVVFFGELFEGELPNITIEVAPGSGN